MSQEEIAAQLGRNRNAIYKLSHDARRAFQRALEEAGYSQEAVRRRKKCHASDPLGIGIADAGHSHEEIGCDTCLEQVASYVEAKLAGLPTPEALRLVEEHLATCGECQQEFAALAEASRDGGEGEAGERRA